MVQNVEMSGSSSIKWYKYRYVLVAGLLLNVLLVNYFFFDSSVTKSSAFGHSFVDHGPDLPATTTPARLSSTSISPPSRSPSSVHEPSSPSVSVVKPVASVVPPPPPNVSPPPTDVSLFNLHDLDVYGAYVGWPLERVCNETKYQPGLVFVCDINSGGVGNIRSFILTCIRYAIEAGATGIKLPHIQQRSEDNLAELFTSSAQPFDYFFDEEHFRSALGMHCPRLAIYNTTDDIPNSQNKTEITEFFPKDLNNDDGGDGRGRNRHLDMYRMRFDKWLSETNRAPKEEMPVTIQFRWAVFFEWPAYRDGPEFAATFGDLLRIRKDIAELAVVTLVEMARFVGSDPYAEEPPTLKAPYLGVHLRSESDALDFWPNFDTQTSGYLEVANNTGLKHVYLACGNATESQRFAQKASHQLQLKVTSKLDLLKGDDLEKLQALTWDQQALVDYLVLSKSTHFTGVSFSSFAMNIAIKRHIMTGGLNMRPWKSPGDVYSTLVGRFESWWGEWLFMLESVW